MENQLNTLTDSSDKQTLKDEDLFIGYKNWNRLITAASTVSFYCRQLFLLSYTFDHIQ